MSSTEAWAAPICALHMENAAYGNPVCHYFHWQSSNVRSRSRLKLIIACKLLWVLILQDLLNQFLFFGRLFNDAHTKWVQRRHLSQGRLSSICRLSFLRKLSKQSLRGSSLLIFKNRQPCIFFKVLFNAENVHGFFNSLNLSKTSECRSFSTVNEHFIIWPPSIEILT